MQRVTLLGLCLITVLAMSAAAAASAGALSGVPIQVTCIKAAKVNGEYTGNYNNKTCSEKAKEKPKEKPKGGGSEGVYELGNGMGKKPTAVFKGNGGSTTLDSYVKGLGVIGQVTCDSTKDTGAVTGPSTMSLTMELRKCASETGVCTSSGAKKKGTIVEGPLSGELGYIEEDPLRVGATYKLPAGAITLTCGAQALTVSGEVIGEITGNINKISKTWNLSFTVNAGGEPEITKIKDEECPPACLFTLTTEVPGVGTFESGENTTSVLKGEAMEAET